MAEVELSNMTSGAFTVEAWIDIDEIRAEAAQVIAASWTFADRPTAMVTYDAGATDGLDTRGFFGGTFAGRYVYFSPQCNDDGRHGNALRFDTHQSFGSPSAWQAYDASITAGLTTKGYYGTLFDGRYVYYVPRTDGQSMHSRVLRHDTTGDFRDDGSWTAYDAGRPISCQGGAFDGRYVYFAPGYHADDGDSGSVLRLDTQADFHDDDSWMWYDASATDGLNCRCYDGAVFDGRHVYFIPLQSGPVLRYDPKQPFDGASSWQAFDPTTCPGFGPCVGGVFDGRYVHFTPYGHSTAVRYDTEGLFRDPASWSSHAPGEVDGLACVGYDGAAFDGRWVYHIPFWDGVSTTEGFHAHLLRYDTAQDFSASSAWQAADGQVLAPPNPGGFNGGAFDGRFLYMCPWRRNDPSGEIRAHGEVLRLDTAGADASFQLRWMDCGHNGGLGGSVPGPSFLVNCGDRSVCAQAHSLPTAGKHHVVGSYDPEQGAALWIDGECVARQPGVGRATMPRVPVTTGELPGGTARLLGRVDRARIVEGWYQPD